MATLRNRNFRLLTKFGLSLVSAFGVLIIILLIYIIFSGHLESKRLFKELESLQWSQHKEKVLHVHAKADDGIHKNDVSRVNLPQVGNINPDPSIMHMKAPSGKLGNSLIHKLDTASLNFNHKITTTMSLKDPALPPNGDLVKQVMKNSSVKEIVTYKFRQSNGNTINGQPFNVSDSWISRTKLNVLLKSLDQKTVEKFVIATAASKHHFDESIPAILNIRQYLPHKKIYYYDLGLASEQAKEVKTWCSVVYRRFNFAHYPSHVQNLKNFAYRPLIIQNLLNEFDGVLWMDSFIRLKSGDLAHVFRKTMSSQGIAQLHKTGYSNFAVTNAAMYSYLPTDTVKQKTTSQGLGDTLMVFRTKWAYDHVLKWWFFCALDEKCIAPTYARKCDFRQGKTAVYVDCHRMDQSALGILLSNAHNFELDSYVVQKSVIEFGKKKGKPQQIQKCAP